MKFFISCLLLLTIYTRTFGQSSLSLGVSDPIDIGSSAPQYAVTIPVTPGKNVDFATIVPFVHPSNVKFERTLDKSLKDAIAVSKDPEGPNIILTLTMASFTKQGVYEVHVGYKNRNKGIEDLAVKLFLPPATLDTVSTVNIDYTSGDIQPGAFVLHEIGGKIAVNGLRLAPPFFSNSGEGRLIYFVDTPVTVPAGAWKRFSYNFDQQNIGKLDFGHHYGKLYLYSDQLSAPTVVGFDLWRRRQRWTIVLVIALGLGLGFLVRHLLKDNKDYEQVRYRGLKALSDMKTQLEMVDDPHFKASMQLVVDPLEGALRDALGGISGNTVAALQAAIDLAMKGYTEARSALQAGIAAQDLVYKELAATYENPSLPPVLVRCLSDSSSTFRDFTKLLHTDINPTAAAAKVPTILQQAKQGFADYTIFLKDVTAFLAGGKFFLSVSAGALKTLINTSARTLQGAIPTAPITIQSPADITTLFKKTAGMEIQFVHLIADLDQNYRYIYKRLNETAAGAPAFTAAYDAYISLLTALVTDTPPLNPTSVRWEAGLAAAVNTAWTAAVGRHVSLAGDEPDLSDIPGLAKQASVQIISHAAKVATTNLQPINIAQALKATRLRYYLFAVTRTVLLVVLLGLSGYQLYGASYSGTTSELFTIFWLAFSTDITLDSVLGAKGKNT